MSEKSNELVKVSYEQVLLFRRNAEVYQKLHAGKRGSFLWAIAKMLARTKKAQEDYNEKIDSINYELCEKNDGFAVMEKVGEKGDEKFKIKAEKQANLRSKIKEALKETIDVEPYVPTGPIPKDIDFTWSEVLTPFLQFELAIEEDEKKDDKKE